MIPLRDDNPTRRFAILTLLLVAANVAVFLYEISLPGQGALTAFFADFALTPAELSYSPTPAVFGTVVSSMFMHGGWMHLIGNMLYLWIFGNNVEDSMSRLGYLLFYLLCGVGAAATQVAVNPQSEIPMVGASGAVSGILGAYLILFPRARVTVLVPIWIFIRFVAVPAWLMLVFWFGLQLLSGALSLGKMHEGGVAFWAHIGGFVTGMIWIPIFKRRGVRLFQ
jgi:membrane associated rhomboid family serine protease